MNQRAKLLWGTIIFVMVVLGANRILTTYRNSNGTGSGSGNGKVLEVTEATFTTEVLQSDKKVLIDFYATWCGPCKQLSPIVEEVAGESDTVKFVKIDVDKEGKLANQYGISVIPTLVVIENGREIHRSVGLIRKQKVKELIQ